MKHLLSTHLFVNHRLTAVWLERIWEAGIAEIEISEGEESVRISRYPAGGAQTLSITVPATLKQLGESGGLTELLYFGSTSHMKAVEACYSPDSTWEWVTCLDGGQDSWEFKNSFSFGDVLSGLSETAETP